MFLKSSYCSPIQKQPLVKNLIQIQNWEVVFWNLFHYFDYGSY